MRVKFLIPPSPGNRRIVRLIECSHESKAAYLPQPNDFLIISSLLSDSDTASLVDATAGKFGLRRFVELAKNGETPDLIFFAFASVVWEEDLKAFEAVREAFPATPIYLIGDIFLEDEYLSFILPRCAGVVFIPYLLDLQAMAARPGAADLPGLRRPGEQREVMRTPVEVKSGVVRHGLFLDGGYHFPFARRFKFATLTTVWGCPFACNYCNMRALPPVVRRVDDVERELLALERLGVRELYVYDRSFGFPQEMALELTRRMAERFSFSWSSYFHPQLYTPELLESMRRAGCHTIIVGVESADVERLALFGRVVERAKLDALLAHAERLKMDVCADFIIGLPHEEEEAILDTIAYARDLPVQFISVNIAAPLPGSGIRKSLNAEGRMVFGREGFDTLGRSGVIPVSSMDVGRLYELRTLALRRFYLRPSYLWGRLRRTSSPEHLLLQLRQALALFRKS